MYRAHFASFALPVAHHLLLPEVLFMPITPEQCPPLGYGPESLDQPALKCDTAWLNRRHPLPQRAPRPGFVGTDL